MSSITSRVYRDESDLQTIIHLTGQIRPPERLNDYPLRMDLEENFASAVVRANTRLWFEHATPIGWAYVSEFNNLHWELDRDYEERVGAEIVEWGEACLRKALADGEAGALTTNCREDYAERIIFLKRHAFSQMEDTTIHMIRPLSQPVAEPVLPPGFIIRPIAGKQEAEAVAAMHRAAFGTAYMTTEKRLIIMSTSEYDPALDLLAVAADGTIAGYCICSINDAEKIGHTDPVATHPRYQRMGVARALLLTGLRLLKERGLTSARLGTSGDNLAMQQAARSVGFQIESTTLWFSKEVS